MLIYYHFSNLFIISINWPSIYFAVTKLYKLFLKWLSILTLGTGFAPCMSMSASSNSSKPGSRPQTNSKSSGSQNGGRESVVEPHAPPSQNPNSNVSRSKSRNPSSLNEADSTGSGSEDGVGNTGDEPVVGNVNKFCAVPPGWEKNSGIFSVPPPRT